MTPEEYKKIWEEQEKIIKAARKTIYQTRSIAAKCKIPDKLRLATSEDIVVGAVLWYKRFDNQKWTIVEEVLRPGDDFKAYMWDGSRYGLDGAFVEVK